MKTILKITLSALLIIGTFTACVDDKDFDTPQVQEVDLDHNVVNFETAKNNLIQSYNQNGGLIYTYPPTSTDVIAAYVISDDTSGNYYKELVVQDNFENPTMGYQIDINQGSLHTTYNAGRKVYIKMAGLSIGYFDGQQGPSPNYANESNPNDSTPGIYKIGITTDDSEVERIPATLFKKFIVASSITETIVPKVVTTDDFTDEFMNTFVQLNNVQFELGELGKTFANEATDAYDAERVLVSCDTDAEFGLMTSTFSNFKGKSVSDKVGTVVGVLTKNYREVSSVIVLNDYMDVNFMDTERCDPPVFCGALAVTGSNVLFEQDFESMSDESALDTLGWTNINVNGGSHRWDHRSFSGNKYIQLGAYNTNEDPLEAWLVTPAINLDNSTDESLTFDANVGYHNGDPVKVYASTDFSGDVATATWELIENVILPTSPTSGYGSFANVGSVNVSCLTGDVYFAFAYIGADNGITTTFQIDNIKVMGN